MNELAYEIIKTTIENIDPVLQLTFADGLTREFTIDTAKLAAELDNDQKKITALEAEADWLARALAEHKNVMSDHTRPELWRKAAKQATGG